MAYDSSRRRCLAIAGAAVLGFAGLPESRSAGKEKDEEMEVPAVEDLMREHGVLRRALLVYSEAATRLSRGDTGIPLAAVGRAASLFRTFGQDYHERSLEEAHVFVPLIKAGGQNGTLARTLTAQHERGREITDYIVAMAKKPSVPQAQVEPFSNALASFVRMYQHHTAIEDTVIFPAWKAALTPEQYGELGEEFEELEHKMFGEDGYQDAVKRIASIEQAFGLGDLNALTAPVPPRVG